MPISKQNGVIVQTPAANFDQFLQTGVIRGDQFSIRDAVDETKQVVLDPSLLASNVTLTIQPQAGSSGTFQLPASAGGVLGLIGAPAVLQYSAPVSAATVTIAAGSTALVIEPAGTLAALTVVLPTAPADGTLVSMSSTQIVTTLTLSAGGADTIVNAIAAFVANGFAQYVYRASSAKWYRIG